MISIHQQFDTVINNEINNAIIAPIGNYYAGKEGGIYPKF
ncbi:hypothetical protein PPRY_a2162 [Pseudoalteromonas prydzensis ACAM 620]|nr:hypothetical protein [Pseudoalteromonas prydzensis ACAM 620]